LRTVPADLAARYRAEGFWTDASLGQVLAAGLATHGSLAFVARSDIHPWSGTLADVLDLARRVAGTLQVWGVGPGDVVAFQLPNWVEAAATFYATTMLGAVVAPIVHFYGAREVGHILRQSEARVLVTCDHFGHVDHLATLETLRPNLPALEHVAVVSPGDAPPPGWAVPFSTLSDGDGLAAPAAVDPAAPALVAYTSGTTSAPKGVVHSHRTIGAEIRQLGGAQPGESHPTLYGAPVGHGIGMLGALLLPVYRGVPIHMIDVWDPSRVLAVMSGEGLASGTGATFFLTSLLDHPNFGPEHLALMSHVGLGGSAVPRAVAERATALGISIVRLYGSTEHPSITGCTHEEPLEKRLSTDGRPLPGCEIRIVDDDERDLAPGEAGEIWSRGPDCFMGYTDPALTAEVFDADGWYRTEDVGMVDSDGYLAITDRRKDIIIRGGENVSAAEIEELLLHLPGVAEVAVVAAPDARLGEHACAVLRMQAQAPVPELSAVQTHLDSAGLARQKWPEELRSVEDFPRTASGKVQKFVLRERLRTGW
jgi:acyl-CoA synthetase (AMP-forming)/AMP-acid ligase II